MFKPKENLNSKSGKSNNKNVPFFNKGGENAFFNIQPKLKIGSPNDKYEKEANLMADKVVNHSLINNSNFLQKKCENCEEEQIQRSEKEEEEVSLRPKLMIQRHSDDDDEIIQKKENNNSKTASNSFASKLQSSNHNGKPLTSNIKNEMESSFHSDFSKVRVHNNSTSHQLSDEINAQAFTYGNNIYFNKNKYNPSTKSGKHLLSHELTHVIQQTGKIQKSEDHSSTNSRSPASENSFTSTTVSSGNINVDVLGAELSGSEEGADPNFIIAASRARGIDIYVSSLEGMIDQLESITRGRNCLQNLTIWNHGSPRGQRISNTNGWSGFDLGWLRNAQNQTNLNRLRNLFCCTGRIIWKGCTTAGVHASGGHRTVEERRDGRGSHEFLPGDFREESDALEHGASLYQAMIGSINAQSWANALGIPLIAYNDLHILYPNPARNNVIEGGAEETFIPSSNLLCNESGERNEAAPETSAIRNEAFRLRQEIIRRHDPQANMEWLNWRIRWDFLNGTNKRVAFINMIKIAADGITPPSPLSNTELPNMEDWDAQGPRIITNTDGETHGQTQIHIALCYPNNYWRWIQLSYSMIEDTPEHTRAIILHELSHAAEFQNLINQSQGRLSRPEGTPPPELCNPDLTGSQLRALSRGESTNSITIWAQYIRTMSAVYNNAHRTDTDITHARIYTSELSEVDRWTYRELGDWLSSYFFTLPINLSIQTPGVRDILNLWQNSNASRKEVIESKFQEFYIRAYHHERTARIGLAMQEPFRPIIDQITNSRESRIRFITFIRRLERRVAR